jgi:hypothetical protein
MSQKIVDRKTGREHRVEFRELSDGSTEMRLDGQVIGKEIIEICREYARTRDSDKTSPAREDLDCLCRLFATDKPRPPVNRILPRWKPAQLQSQGVAPVVGTDACASYNGGHNVEGRTAVG